MPRNRGDTAERAVQNTALAKAVLAIKFLSVQKAKLIGVPQNAAGVRFSPFAPGANLRLRGCRFYNSPSLRKLSSRDLPMIRWSWTAIPMTSPAATMRAVMAISACEGVGSPEG